MVRLRRQFRHERHGCPRHHRRSCRSLVPAPPQQTGRRPQRPRAPARPQRRPDQGPAALGPSDRGPLFGALGGATRSHWTWQGDVGLRAATEAGGFDLALVGAWLERRAPLLTVDPDLGASLLLPGPRSVSSVSSLVQTNRSKHRVPRPKQSMQQVHHNERSRGHGAQQGGAAAALSSPRG